MSSRMSKHGFAQRHGHVTCPHVTNIVIHGVVFRIDLYGALFVSKLSHCQPLSSFCYLGIIHSDTQQSSWFVNPGFVLDSCIE